jgi:spermidine/putrescine transport system substrate-binding protein
MQKPYNMKNILLFLFGLVVLGLAGCGKNGPEFPEPLASSAPKVLRVYSWSDYFDPEVLKTFEQEAGVSVEYGVFGSTDEMEAKLRSEPGKWDVVVVNDNIIDELAELRLIRKLDHSKLPNMKNLADRRSLSKNTPFDPENELSIPYMWGTTLVAYRKDKIPNPEQSWNLLWDPALQGKVRMIGERFEILSIPQILLGQSINSSDPQLIRAATDKLIEQIENDVRIGDDADVREGLDAGDVWAAMCYSGDAAMVVEKNENVDFFIPKEGAPLWIDCFAVVRDSSAMDLAHDFVNFMLDAEIAAKSSNYTWHDNLNHASRPHIDEELLSNPHIIPPAEVMDKCSWFTKLDAKREQLLNEAWLEVQRKLKDRQQEVAKVDGDRVSAEFTGVESEEE